MAPLNSVAGRAKWPGLAFIPSEQIREGTVARNHRAATFGLQPRCAGYVIYELLPLLNSTLLLYQLMFALYLHGISFCLVSFNLGVFLLLTLSRNVFVETDPQKSEVRLEYSRHYTVTHVTLM